MDGRASDNICVFLYIAKYYESIKLTGFIGQLKKQKIWKSETYNAKISPACPDSQGKRGEKRKVYKLQIVY